jgi:hypothetical protein
MNTQDTVTHTGQSLQARCFEALRVAHKKLSETRSNNTELNHLVVQLEDVLFSAEPSKPASILKCFIDLIFVLKEMENNISSDACSLRPIGLQVATSNSIIPIHLEWNYHNPNSIFVIEYAQFEESNKPEWRIYSKTRATSFTVRGLPKGKSYWFRISALAPAV